MLLVVVPVACSSGGSSEPPPTLEPIAITVLVTAGAPTTTLLAIDPALVDDCVAYVKFGAFTQNVMLAAMWDAAGQDDGVLRTNCVSLGRDDPGALQALSDGWASVQQVLTSTSTSSTTTTIVRRPSRTTLPPVDTEAPVDQTVPATTPEVPVETTVAPTETTLAAVGA